MRTNRSRQTLYLLIEKILSPLTCNIIAISASEQNQALQHKIISQKKISLILNGIDVNKYVKSLENKAIMMNQLGISKGTKVIGMVARIAPQKDVFTFVRAAKRIVDKNNNVFFILVGDGEQRLEIEQEISHLGLSDKFLITGWVDNVQDYINIFHVGVLTSRWEGFGLVLAEYMASEVPVVASNVDGIPEVVEDGMTGVLVEPGDVEGFAAATQQLLVDEDLREKYTTQGLVRVRSKFSIDRVAGQHEELYNSIHEKRPKIVDPVSNRSNHISNENNKVAKTALIIMIISILGRGLGFVRESILASHFGASLETDAYKIAFSIPIMILATLSALISTTLIPIYSDYIKHKTKQESDYYINNLINIVSLISLAITIVCFLLTPFLIKILAPGFHGEAYDLTIKLTLIMLPSIIFYALCNISEGYLQSNKIFIITASTAIPFNLFIILSILIPANRSIEVVTIGSLIAVASQFLVQVPFMRKNGFHYKRVLNFKDEGLKKTFFLMIPVFLSSSFIQLNIFLNRMLASTLAVGSISSLDYADKVNNIIYNIIIGPIIMLIFPKLSSLYDDHKEFCEHLLSTFKTIIHIALPTTIFLLVFSQDITSLLYERGEFSSQATYTTALALKYYALGIPGICIVSLLVKTFYSIKDSKTPMKNEILIACTNIVLSFLLLKSNGVAGLAFSASFAYTIGSGTLLYCTYKRFPQFDTKKVLRTFFKTLIVSIIIGASLFFMNQLLISTIFIGTTFVIKFLRMAILAILGALIYLGYLYIEKRNIHA